jgi:uncharacterized cupredoxin-like copper-binding protein
MGDRPTEPETDTGDTGGGPGPGSRPGMPRWVKVFAGVFVAVGLLIVVKLFTGGGEHGPGRHLGGRGGQNPGAVGGPADAGEAARTIEVTTLDAMRFQPGTISVSAGETVTFVVTNRGRAIHEFTLGDAAMQKEHADAMAHTPSEEAHATPNSFTLQPGETKQLTWRFGDAGTIEFACHVPGHYDAGMRGHIAIA